MWVPTKRRRRTNRSRAKTKLLVCLFQMHFSAFFAGLNFCYLRCFDLEPKSPWWKRSRPDTSPPSTPTSPRRRPARRLPQRIPWPEMIHPTSTSTSAKNGSLTKEEEMNEHVVAWATYWAFVRAGGAWLFIIVLFTQLGGQVLSIYANFWLTNWGANTRMFQVTYLRDMPLSRSLYWYRGYAVILMASVALVTFRFVLFHSHFVFSHCT